MSLDLGALVAHATIEDVSFQRSYVRLVRQFADLGAQATATSAGTNRLDESLAQAAAAGNAAAAGLGHADKAMAEAGLSASEAAIAASKLTQAQLRQSVATQRIADVQASATLTADRLTAAEARLAELQAKEGVSADKVAAAQMRVNQLRAASAAATGRATAAEASLLASNDRLALSSERLGKATGFTSQAWQGLGHGMLIAGGLIAAGFAIAGKETADFDAKMALVRTLAKASPSDMAKLRTAALTVGQAYGYSAGQVADAEAELVKAGISVKDIMGGALRGALTLAAAGQEDVASATSTAAVAMTQFGLSGRDVPHIADLLAAGADKALGSVHDLSEALNYGGLAAAQAGMSIEQTVGVLAELAQSGQIGSTAGSQLAMMLRNLEKPTTAAQAVMKQYGITVYDATGRMLPMTAIAGELHDKIGSLAPANRDAALATLFTSRAVRAANILMREGAAATAEWINKVNDQGFAALQASGKLDSLSGDLTKLKSALQAAFIGVGESSQGPLRSMIQDVTTVVEAWNSLPGPVRAGAEALLALAGAATLAGGAALVLIPKWAAMNVALEDTRIGAISAGTALKGLAGAGAAIAVLTALYEGVKLVEKALAPVPPDIDLLTSAVKEFGKEGVIAGELSKAFGGDLNQMADEANKIVSGGTLDKLAEKLPFANGFGGGANIKEATADFKSLDAALSGLVTGGSADTASSAFDRFNVRLRAAGLTTKQITSLFPEYSKALASSAASAQAAGTGIDQYGNAVSGAAAKTKRLTDAAKSFNDAMHALADPLFAMNQALADLRSKQSAATQAIHKYGAGSRQARQAQLDLASSALDVAAASKTLSASVKGGTTSLGAAKAQLHGWVAAGLITQHQADAVARSFGGLIDRANHVAGSLRNAAAGAKTAGEGIGHDFAAGVAIGIDNNSVTAEKAAIQMAQKAAAAARSVKGFHSSSPSRVGRKIGGEFGDGVAAGIDSSTAHVVDSTTKMTQAATLKADQLLQAHLKTQIQAVAAHLKNVQSNAQSLSSGVSSSLTGAFDISNAPNVSVKGLTSFLAYGAKSTAAFDKLEHRLIAKHLSPALVQQLAALEANNPGEGLAAARNILAGGSGAIRRLDRLENQIHRSATRAGQAISKQQFGGEMHRLATKLDTLHHDLDNLTHSVHNLAREANLAQHKATARTHHR